MRSRRPHRRLSTLAAALLAGTFGLGISAASADPGDGSGPDGDDRVRTSTSSKAGKGKPAGIGLSGTQLAPDQIGRSANMELLKNVNPAGPLADSTGTDIAFEGNRAYVGNYDGFTIYDVSKPANPRMLSQVVCPGAQNDVSVSGNLLYLGTDSSRSDDSCASTSQPATQKDS